MHFVEPFYNWRGYYIAAEDPSSPFYGREYSEFAFSNTVYNFYIHPQWDEFGSQTLFLKILFVDYEEKYAVLEFIGEWNDAIEKDWGGQAMQDYLVAIDSSVAQVPSIDKDKLGAVGASYGGYSVYYLAGIHNNRFKAFVSHCGLFNLESWYGTTEAWRTVS